MSNLFSNEPVLIIPENVPQVHAPTQGKRLAESDANNIFRLSTQNLVTESGRTMRTNKSNVQVPFSNYCHTDSIYNQHLNDDSESLDKNSDNGTYREVVRAKLEKLCETDNYTGLSQKEKRLLQNRKSALKCKYKKKLMFFKIKD